MNKWSRSVGLMFLCGSAWMGSAHAMELDVSHQYEDLSREHTDELEISHDFDSGIGIGSKLKFHPHEQDDGSSGKAFHDDRLAETEFKVNYNWKFAENWAVEPGFGWTIKDHEDKYKPSLKLKYSPLEHTKLSVRYRDEISHKDDKPTKRVDRIDSEISQKIGAWKLTYTNTYYHGNTALFDNSKHDYEHEFEVGYQVTKHVMPYITLKNESLDDDSSSRQTEYGVGVSYEF